MKINESILCIMLLFFLLLCGCTVSTKNTSSVDYVKINSTNEFDKESAFIKSLFESEDFSARGLQIIPNEPGLSVSSNGGKNFQPAVNIDFFSFWEHEKADGDIIITKKILIPIDDALAGRTNTSFQACIDGNETLIQTDELKPPFAALRVDGLALGDEGYPLIWITGIRYKENEEIKTSRRFQENYLNLKNVISSAQKPDIQLMPQTLWIAAGGDTMLGRGATEILINEGPAGIFGETAQMLASSDIALLNLEGVISANGERVPKSYNFRFIPEIAAALRDAGIDAVLHANNHVFDYGSQAFLDSLSWLEKAGIGVAGAGINDDAASQPYVFSKGGDVVRVFGIASFPREQNGWDGVTAAAEPDKAGMLHAGKGGAEKLKCKMSANDSSVNIVFFHGGVEWSTRPDAATRQLYTGLIEAGADLVIGTHPHVVQGFEWVHGKPVFWSLGNYVFGGMNGWYGGDEGLFIRLGYCQGRLFYIEPFPLFLNNTRTDIVSQDKLETFYARSKELQERP